MEDVMETRPAHPVVQRGGRKKSRGSRYGLLEVRGQLSRRWYVSITLSSFLLPLIAWAALTYPAFINPYILPTPTAVLFSLRDMLIEGTLLPDVGISTYRIMAGFLISSAMAIPIGILMGSFKVAEAFLEPMTGFIRYLPAVALIPLVMVWAGIDETAKILIIWIGTFFQMVLVIADVTRNVSSDLLNVARTLGAGRRQLLRHVLVPATLPGVLQTSRVMVGWAWTYLVVAELVATDSGIGYRIMNAQRFLRTDDIFAGILVIGLLGLATDMLFKFLTPRIVSWDGLDKR